jgi:RNA polymerase primary sigma factor
MKDATGQYLNQIGLVPLLDADQERELAQRIEAGRQARDRLDTGEDGAALTRAVRSGERAKDHFIRANLRLVVNLARRYPLPPGMELLDLIQEGSLGLEHAVDKFDWRRGFKFSTYAAFWIRQAISRALDQKGSLIRLPGERSAKLRAALRTTDGTTHDLDEDLAELHRLTTPTSFDRPIGEHGETELGDFLASTAAGPESVVIDQMHHDLTVELLDSLDPPTRQAVALRMGLTDDQPRTYREVGEAIGVSDEAARRIVSRALVQLRGKATVLGLAA